MAASMLGAVNLVNDFCSHGHSPRELQDNSGGVVILLAIREAPVSRFLRLRPILSNLGYKWGIRFALFSMRLAWSKGNGMEAAFLKFKQESCPVPLPRLDFTGLRLLETHYLVAIEYAERIEGLLHLKWRLLSSVQSSRMIHLPFSLHQRSIHPSRVQDNPS